MYSSISSLPQNGKSKFENIPPSYQGNDDVQNNEIVDTGIMYF